VPRVFTRVNTAAARRIGAVVAVAGLTALALTGCSSSTSGADCVQPGSASKLVSVSGSSTPAAKFPTPLVSSSLQKSIVKAGHGETVGTGQFVVMNSAFYEAKNGSKLTDGTIALVAGGTTEYAGLQKALGCSTVGSRIAVTGTASEMFGANLSATGLSGDDSIVFVADLQKAYLARANGTPQPAGQGMPTVVLAPNGRPGIKITAKNPPSTQRVAVLKAGSGATVKSSSQILVNYTAVTWAEPDQVASSSWSDGVPAVWPSDSSSSSYTPPAGVLKALVGHKVGSQIQIVTSGSDATVFVVDLLGIVN
jgi:FKBP-type peptidyl-prolyl cis-trans isomerase